MLTLLRLFALAGFLLLLFTVLTGGHLDAPWLPWAAGSALALAALLDPARDRG